MDVVVFFLNLNSTTHFNILSQKHFRNLVNPHYKTQLFTGAYSVSRLVRRVLPGSQCKPRRVRHPAHSPGRAVGHGRHMRTDHHHDARHRAQQRVMDSPSVQDCNIASYSKKSSKGFPFHLWFVLIATGFMSAGLRQWVGMNYAEGWSLKGG